jgi:hypothetical protein
MLNWVFGDEKERDDTGRLKIKLATASIKMFANFDKTGPLLVEFLPYVPTLIETSSLLPE